MFTNELQKNQFEAIHYSLKTLSEDFNKVTEDNFQILLGISGTTGTGKTTLAVKLAKRGDPNFSINRNVLINPSFADVVQKVTELPHGAYVVLDEAINVCYKMEWYSNTVKAFGKFLNKCRMERKKIIFCIPNFGDISKNIRQNINLWVQVLARGRAMFLTKSPFFMASDRWDLKAMERTLRKHLNKRYVKVTTDELLKLIRKNKHYAGEIKYTAMSDQLEAEYDILRAKDKYSDLIDLMNRGDGGRNDKIRMLRFALWRVGLPYTQIGAIEGTTAGSISTTLSHLSQENKDRIDIYLKKKGHYAKHRFNKKGKAIQGLNLRKKAGDI